MSARGTARPGWLARLFGGRRAADGGEASDPALLLARDWLVARGGRVSRVAPGLIEGTLPDGTPVRYTNMPQRAREEVGLALLLPGTPELAALQRAIAERSAGWIYRVRRAPADAMALARAAFAPPAAGCARCSEEPGAAGRGPLCAPCPLRQGRIVVAGAGAVRRVTVERADERSAYEYAFRLRVASAQAEREEIVRVAVDAASGERLAPLDLALLAGAEAVQSTGRDGADGDAHDGPQVRLAEAERIIELAAQAAARLARARALPDYERQQDDLAATFERLLLEDPAAAREALAARERALARLVEAHAIGVETQLVAATAALTPLARVRVRFGGGTEARAEVDPCRGKVTARCEACGEEWRVGARCAEGHVTCLACQERCTHCGERRCTRCAAAPFAGCHECGAASCAACARTTARGRHRVMAGITVGGALAEDVDGLEPSDPDAGAGPDDLRVADLDSMTPATWRECVAWLLDGLGYDVERDMDGVGADLAFVCRAPAGGVSQGAANREGFAPRTVVAVAHRPGEGLLGGLALADLERARALAKLVDGAGGLLLTTACADGLEHPGIEVRDRAWLAAWLADRRVAHQRARDADAEAMEERAAAAGRVRAVLLDGLEEAHSRLVVDQTLPDVAPSAAGSGGERIQRLAAQADTARQALAALETLIGQWEAAFAPTASRDGTQAITATVGDLDGLAERAEHLLGVLREACADIGPAGGSGRLLDWLAALRDELGERCQALAARVRALDPSGWHDFSAVRDDRTARASVEHEAAARRAGARAQGLRDVLDVPGARAPRAARSGVARKRT
jgi:hypothetical protein